MPTGTSAAQLTWEEGFEGSGPAKPLPPLDTDWQTACDLKLSSTPVQFIKMAH